jgi:hypothetical protein
MKFLFPIVSILISGALFFIFVQPLSADVSQLRTDVASYSVALDNSTFLQKTQDTLLDQYKNVQQSDQDRLGAFLPSTVDNIQFILQMEQIANLYNMPLKNIKFDTPDDSTAAASTPTPATGSVLVAGGPDANLPYGVFTLQFETDGTYDSFTSFLKDVEQNLRLADVQSISFEVPPPVLPGAQAPVAVKGAVGSDPNASDPNVYDFTVKVNTYWLK